ncbi:MAG: hypothetical protein HQL38_11725 [Alphaproteobacteria bacterium]|nr:hypothetical protein [Alphaproteobacteria bacterium]
MKFGTFFGTWRETRRSNGVLLGVVLAQSIALVLVGGRAFSRSETIVLVPPTLTESVKIGKQMMGESASVNWGTYLALLMGNVTPESADFVKAAVGEVVDPSIHRDVMDRMTDEIERLKRDRVSQRFEARTAFYEAATNKVFVTGNGFVVGAGGKETRYEKTFEAEMVVKNYRPSVLFLNTYEGKPRTEKERKRDAAEVERNDQRQRRNGE